MRCPRCGSNNVIKKGKRRGKQRYYCKDCGRYFVSYLIERTKSQSKTETKSQVKSKSESKSGLQNQQSNKKMIKEVIPIFKVGVPTEMYFNLTKLKDAYIDGVYTASIICSVWDSMKFDFTYQNPFSEEGYVNPYDMQIPSYKMDTCGIPVSYLTPKTKFFYLVVANRREDEELRGFELMQYSGEFRKFYWIEKIYLKKVPLLMIPNDFVEYAGITEKELLSNIPRIIGTDGIVWDDIEFYLKINNLAFKAILGKYLDAFYNKYLRLRPKKKYSPFLPECLQYDGFTKIRYSFLSYSVEIFRVSFDMSERDKLFEQSLGMPFDYFVEQSEWIEKNLPKGDAGWYSVVYK